MANIKDWLLEYEKDCSEIIEAIVVGRHYDADWDSHLEDENIVLSREDGLKKLDQEYDNGFGGANCFPMCAWTKNWVLFIREYDGATDLAWVPRNPQPYEPSF